MFWGIELVTPVVGEVKLSWTELLNWPIEEAVITRSTVVPFRKVVEFVIGVHWEDACLGVPIITVREKSGAAVVVLKKRKNVVIPAAITAMMSIADTSFFLLLLGRTVTFFGLAVLKPRITSEPFDLTVGETSIA